MKAEIKRAPPAFAGELRLLVELALRQLDRDLRELRRRAARSSRQLPEHHQANELARPPHRPIGPQAVRGRAR